MFYTFQINDENFISLNYDIYFNELDKEFAIFIYDIEENFLQDIQNNKKHSKLSLISDFITMHLILNTGNNKYAFKVYENKELIKKMIDEKKLEIGIIFKEHDVLIEDLCFTIDY